MVNLSKPISLEKEEVKECKILADIIPKFNLAYFNNSVPVVYSIRVVNETSQSICNAALTLYSDPELFKPKTWHIDELAAGATCQISNIDLELNASLLSRLTEAEVAGFTFVLETECNGHHKEIARSMSNIELLPRNQWGGLGHVPDMVAAFVQPNDVAVDRLLKRAAELLRSSNKLSALNGYEDGPRHAWQLASAAWGAIAQMKLDYALPPASFEQSGQKVRSPSQIADTGLATCLDLTLFFCAVLEQMGLNPVAVFTQGHAFVGVWLSPSEFPTVITDDITAVRNRVRLKELILFETTFVTQSPVPRFRYAVERGAMQISEDREDEFEMLLDIRRARLQRIKPLASDNERVAKTAHVILEDTEALSVDEGDDFSEEHAETECEDFSSRSPKDRLERWQRKLLDLSLRNNLLNFKVGKRALKLEAPNPGAVEDILASGNALKLLTRPDLMDGIDPREKALYELREHENVRRRYAEDALKRKEVFVGLSSSEMDARLTELYRSARTALQESGSNTLYLAIGFLVWTREDRKGQRYRAPLVLVPISLERKSIRSGFSIMLHDDAPLLNPTLLEMLHQDFELSLGSLEAELPRDEAGLDIADIWRRVGHIIKDIPGWELSEDVVLSMFSFAKYLMWKDLSENIRFLRENPVVQHLLDTPRDSFVTHTPFPDVRALDHDYQPADVFCPLPSDSSQLAAVMAAAKGKDFVLIGPPGTGKSQTIANMIAQSIAKGRRVLFVSEKMAALDVVYRRLREVGLGDFCLELHSNKARKADVLSQLKTAWQAKASVDVDERAYKAQRLGDIRSNLNDYVCHLHHKYRNGYSIFDAISRVVSQTSVPHIALSWASLDVHDQKAMHMLADLADRLEVNAKEVGAGSLKEHGLAHISTTEWSPQLQQQLLQMARDMQTAIMNVKCAVDGFIAESQLPAVPYTPSALEGVSILSMALPEALGHEWLFVLSPSASSIAQQISDACDLIDRHSAIGAELSSIWSLQTVAKAQKGLDLLERRESIFNSISPLWTQSVTDDLHKGIDLLERQAELIATLSTYYNDGINELDVEQLYAQWNLAEQAFWLKSWLIKRRISRTLESVQVKSNNVDVFHDLAQWIAIRSVRAEITKLDIGTACPVFWKGAHTDIQHVITALELQEAIVHQKNNQPWNDENFLSVEQGELGEILKTELERLRTIVQLDNEIAGLAELTSETDALWQGLATDRQALGSAVAFITERRGIEEQGSLCGDHLSVANGACGETLERDIALLKQRSDIEKKLKEFDDFLERVPFWRGLKTPVSQARKSVVFQRHIAKALSKIVREPAEVARYKSALSILLGDGNALLGQGGAIADAGLTLRNTLDVLKDHLSQFIGLGQLTKRAADEVAAFSLEELEQECSTLLVFAPRLKAWCAWQKVRGEAFAEGLAPLIYAMEEGSVSAENVRQALDVNYARWWLNAAVDNDAVIRQFVSAEHEQRITDFRALDDKFTSLTRDWLKARLCEELPTLGSVSRTSEWGLLWHEMQKKTRHLPLRELINRAPNALTKLTPCLLMSPLSIAQYLPAGAVAFDIVIFDEASQIPVWDAIGAMARGRQVVMVGDPKQLPPTSFFSRTEVEDDDDGVVDKELESILDECIGANLPTLNLNWHYRSRHESLITFSNSRYYSSKLITFPSPYTKDNAVTLYPIEGIYDRGGARTNDIEARALINHLISRLKMPGFKKSGHTVGIVTFNKEQQKLIEDILDEECRKDASLEPYFSDGLIEPIFVKNLESVQGDERDIIYFSVTYGKDTEGYLAMNFGPLNRAGGERRLNVAITRARQELVIFSTLRPEQIDLSRAKGDGARDLKHFLEFAQRGPQALTETDLGNVGGFDSPFEEAVAAALVKKGWQVQPQIGVSSFRIGLGVIHPDIPGKFLAGIECDGTTYHRSATAQDRDKLRELVLRGLGWKIIRVWSTDWWIDAASTATKVDQKLSALLESARARQAEAEMEQNAAPLLLTENISVGSTDTNWSKEDGQLEDNEEQAVSENGAVNSRYEQPYSGAVSTAASTNPLELYQSSKYVPMYQESDPAIAVSNIVPEQFFDEDYTPILQSMIAYVINNDGPILDSVLAKRIARAHGWGRTGTRIKKRVVELADALFKSHTEAVVGTFYWPVHLSSSTSIRFRRPGDGISRNIMEISLPELSALVEEMRQQGNDGETLVYAVSKELKITKLVSSGRARIEEAINYSGTERR